MDIAQTQNKQYQPRTESILAHTHKQTKQPSFRIHVHSIITKQSRNNHVAEYIAQTQKQTRINLVSEYITQTQNSQSTRNCEIRIQIRLCSLNFSKTSPASLI